MEETMSEFVRDRNEAFASMDEKKIREYCEKYEIQMPNDKRLFWIGVNKAVCNLFMSPNSPITIEQYNSSYEWLKKRGIDPVVKH